MNVIDVNELDDKLLSDIDLIVEEGGYESREQAIHALLAESASRSVGVSTGGADLRNLISINNCNANR